MDAEPLFVVNARTRKHVRYLYYRLNKWPEKIAREIGVNVETVRAILGIEKHDEKGSDNAD